jgi:hypothetical protein
MLLMCVVGLHPKKKGTSCGSKPVNQNLQRPLEGVAGHLEH